MQRALAPCTRQCDLRSSQMCSPSGCRFCARRWRGSAIHRPANRGTVGGSLAHADPAAELPLVAQVLGAEMHVRSCDGRRALTACGFFMGPLTTALDAKECLEEIHWPVWNERRVGSSFMEVSRRHGDFAMIEACAQVALDDNGHCTRVVFGLRRRRYYAARSSLLYPPTLDWHTPRRRSCPKRRARSCGTT
jgi:hypothetical protein